MLDTILSGIISTSQKTPFRGRGGYSNLPKERQKTATPLDKAEAEAADVDRFFRFFPVDVRSEIRGKRILDFGSGYGGRTVEYVRTCGASGASGVEPFQACIDGGNEIAKKMNLTNEVDFRLCTQDNIPYDDASFDAVITFDVLEHVSDPRVSLKEIQRVLKPGGRLYAAFPVYRGAISHHLDYLTMVPGLHLVFSPERIMRVVNRHLDMRPDIIVDRHYTLPRHFKKNIPVLPMLNGMGLSDFMTAIEGWNVQSITINSLADIVFGHKSIPARVAKPLTRVHPFLAEPFIFNVAAILETPINTPQI